MTNEQYQNLAENIVTVAFFGGFCLLWPALCGMGVSYIWEGEGAVYKAFASIATVSAITTGFGFIGGLIVFNGKPAKTKPKSPKTPA